jgi:hypothetical protein
MQVETLLCVKLINLALSTFETLKGKASVETTQVHLLSVMQTAERISLRL